MESDKNRPVPRFGDWDEKDPASADGFTGIFESIENKKGSSGKAPAITTESPSYFGHSNSPKTKKCSCFGWLKK